MKKSLKYMKYTHRVDVKNGLKRFIKDKILKEKKFNRKDILIIIFIILTKK